VELMADNVINYRRSSVSKSKSTLPNGVSLLVVASTFLRQHAQTVQQVEATQGALQMWRLSAPG